jgi:hypothetical protein
MLGEHIPINFGKRSSQEMDPSSLARSIRAFWRSVVQTVAPSHGDQGKHLRRPFADHVVGAHPLSGGPRSTAYRGRIPSLVHVRSRQPRDRNSNLGNPTMRRIHVRFELPPQVQPTRDAALPVTLVITNGSPKPIRIVRPETTTGRTPFRRSGIRQPPLWLLLSSKSESEDIQQPFYRSFRSWWRTCHA